MYFARFTPSIRHLTRELPFSTADDYHPEVMFDSAASDSFFAGDDGGAGTSILQSAPPTPTPRTYFPETWHWDGLLTGYMSLYTSA